MRIWIGLVLAFLVCFAPNALAAGDDSHFRQIKGKTLKNLFIDKTVIAEYQDINGGIKNYRFTEHHNADGTTDYIEAGEKTEKGLWKIIGQDKICYKYPGNQVFTKTYCFFVYKDETCYYNYGVGSMTLKGPKNRDWWTSRFIIKGQGGSCEVPTS